MRAWLALVLLLALPAAAQEQPARKKPAAKPLPHPHSKATAQQIRRFNELAKKRQPSDKK